MILGAHMRRPWVRTDGPLRYGIGMSNYKALRLMAVLGR